MSSPTVELPNSNWIRSPKQPNYALCLDIDDRFFGWKMMENEFHGKWSSVARLTEDEVVKALGMACFVDYKEQLEVMLGLFRGGIYE